MTPYIGRQAIPISVALILLGVAPASADEQLLSTERYQVRVETIVSGLIHPWGLDFLPDGRFLVTERNDGQLRIGTREGELSDPVGGVPEVFRYEGETGRSQAGLFDVKVHPGFERNRLIYLSYAQPTDRGATTSILRARLVEDGEGARLEEAETIFAMKPEDQDSSGLHFGGRIAIDPADTALFLSIGERRNISRAQDANDQAGSIIRVSEDGTIPSNNPFLGEENKDDAIFAIGVRNPQVLAVHPETGELWASDHGPLAGDEINLVQAGENYGWPYITSGRDYSGAPIGGGTEKEGMVSPVYVFEETFAPSGMAFYAGDMFPQWRGHMLVGGIEGRALARLAIDQENGAVEKEFMLEGLDRRIRDVVVARDGAVWLLTEHENGEALRVSRVDDGAAAQRQPRR